MSAVDTDWNELDAGYVKDVFKQSSRPHRRIAQYEVEL